MPTMGRFGRDEIAEQLHDELMDKFSVALEENDTPLTEPVRRNITMFFCNEVSPEWIHKSITSEGVNHANSKALTLGVIREWRNDPELTKLFKAYGEKDMWRGV